MTEYSLSVVQICPSAYKDAANRIAEEAGYGPNNLSVQLRHSDSSVWWGCHAWWIPSALEAALNPPDEVPGTADILQHIITSVREGGDPRQHWFDALSENGLSIVESAP